MWISMLFSEDGYGYLYGGGLAVTKCVRGGGFPFKMADKCKLLCTFALQ